MTEYEVVLDTISKNPFPFALIIFCIIELILMKLAIDLWNKHGKPVQITLMAFMIICAFFAGFYYYTFNDMKVNIADKYFQNEFEIVEGLITDYTAADTNTQNNAYDTFKVNGIEFRTHSVTGYGYDQNQCDGGVLENGIKVRISYIPYKYENVIMKLEIAISLIN